MKDNKPAKSADELPETASESLPPGGGSWLRLPDGSLVPNNDAATAADKNEE